MDTLKYIIVTNLLALGFWPLSTLLFGRFPDRGWVFSKIIGISLSAWSIWLLASLKLVAFSTSSAIITSIIVAGFIWGLINSWSLKSVQSSFNEALSLFIGPKKNSFVILAEVIFVIAFLGWNEIRTHKPEIYGLEKFQDYGFLLSAYKSQYFPPLDHFFARETINIYYFTHFIAAFLARITFTVPHFAFNLQTTLIFALTLSASFSLSMAIGKGFGFTDGKSKLAGILGATMVALMGNLHYGFYLLVKFINNSFGASWDLSLLTNQPYHYPAATRYIPFTIHEFPLYSFAVNDMHAHLSNIPQVLLCLAIFYVAFCEILSNTSKRYKWFYFFCLSFSLGIFYPSNSWDYAIYLLLFGFCAWVLFAYLDQEDDFFMFLRSRVLIQTGLSSIFVLLVSVVPFLPFWLTFHPPAHGVAAIPSGKGSALHQLFIIWCLHIFFAAFYYYVIHNDENYQKIKSTISKNSVVQSQLFVKILFLLSFLLILLPEILYVKDIYPGHFRANTMFKLGFQAWIMMGIAIGPVALYIWSEIAKHGPVKTGLYRVVSILLLFVGLMYSHTAVYVASNLAAKSQSLDGMEFIKGIDSDDHDAISWMNENIPDQPTILEAVGDSYSFYGRVSTFTGFPTVLGWPVHEWLWRGSIDKPVQPVSRLEKATGTADTVQTRINDVLKFYETKDSASTKEFLLKYNVEYIYIGKHEREKYPNLQEEKMLEFAEIAYSNGAAKLYKVRAQENEQ